MIISKPRSVISPSIIFHHNNSHHHYNTTSNISLDPHHVPHNVSFHHQPLNNTYHHYQEHHHQPDLESFVKFLVYSQYTCCGVSGTNIFMHGLGLIMLLSTYNSGRHIQHVHMINIAAIELLKNIFWLIDASTTSLYLTSPQSNQSLYIVFSYITLVRFSTLIYLHFSAMFLITGDRLVASLLEAKYFSICTYKRSKLLIVGSWLFCWLLTFPLVSFFYFTCGMSVLNEEGVVDLLIVYVQTVLASLFLIFALTSYFVIFGKYLNNKQKFTEEKLSAFQVFRRSKFYVSILMVTSHLCLVVLPLLLYTVSRIIQVHLPNVITLYIDCSILLSDSVDAVIYVFLYHPVRKLLTKRRFHQSVV